MAKPFLVFEDITKAEQRKLFSFLGVEWLATRCAWLSPLFSCALGFAVALFAESGFGNRICMGLLYGALLHLTNTIHTIGHIVSGTLAGTRMDANILTATRDVNVYRGSKKQVGRGVRVIRATGGPLMNALVGAACLVTYDFLGAEWLRMFAFFNVGVGLWTLMPIPSQDGSVIWGALIRSGEQR